MTTLMERVANERRRLRSVRQGMVAAIAQGSGGDESYVPFYVAAADYIDATMARLHGQDVRMGDMIREKVEEIDENLALGLRELDERLKGAEAHLKPFLAARDALKSKGVQALAEFEREGKAYSDFIVANMGHHGPTSDVSAKLFSPADWEYMAAISDGEVAREAELFDRFEAARPANLPVQDT